MPPLPLTVGTAGHIDHGKTALVRALTGRDTDRLAEERRRGMSIELGFADLDLGTRRLSLVDVPGHERFVRTMIAGASGVDMFVLALAADDGPMPQTLEHLSVLRALGIERGVVALTKVDLVEDETRRIAAARCAELAPGLPVVAVSSLTGEGLEDLRSALGAVAADAEADRAALRAERADAADEPVLHVDRSFTVPGHGTVVTGTLWSGRLRRGQAVTILPGGRAARVRSIEVHDRQLEAVDSHQRVALNLRGVDRDGVGRGDVVATEAADVSVTFRVDVTLTAGAEAIAAEPRVQVHLGTRDSPGRVVDLGGGAVQLRLERPLLARAGDRVVVRRIAPPDTLGGGLVRDPSPPRHRAGWERSAPGARAGKVTPATEALEGGGDSKAAPAAAGENTSSELGDLARRVLAALQDDGYRPRGAERLATDLGAGRREVESAFAELAAAGEAVRAKADVVYATSVYRKLERLVLALAERDGSVRIATVRDALGLSRKYAQALLEQLDSERLLRREGDHHLPRRRTPG